VPVVPQITVEVADVGAVHAQAPRRDLEIMYPLPLTDEPWGVRLFFVKIPPEWCRAWPATVETPPLPDSGTVPIYGETNAQRERNDLLGWLPLALEQAGAYVRETRLPLSAYLDRLRQFPAMTLTKGNPRDRDPADTVATTWQVSLERVQTTPGAVALLEVCAFLGPEEIPRDLVVQQLGAEIEEFAGLSDDPFALDETVASVRRYGLAKVSEHALVMHRLLQQVIRDRLDLDRRARRAAGALRLIRRVLPTDATNPEAWPTYARLLPHALAVTGHAQVLDIEPEATAWLLSEAGLYLLQRADHKQAHALLELPEEFEIDIRAPEQTGVHKGWVTIYATEGDCGVHPFQLNVAA
jgi:hypothetical protein